MDRHRRAGDRERVLMGYDLVFVTQVQAKGQPVAQIETENLEEYSNING